MLNLAKTWEWAGGGTETALEKLLKQMMDESDPWLPFGFIKLDEVLMQIYIFSVTHLMFQLIIILLPYLAYFNVYRI